MHSLYYNKEGIEVPSVTTILKVVNKPELINWAHYMGRRHISIDEILEKSSYFGTCIHEYLECYFNNGHYVGMYSEALNRVDFNRATNNFRWFMKDKTYEPIIMEESRVCDKFGGTLDYYGYFEGKKMLIDFKTSKTVYSTYLLQLGGYYELLKDEFEVDSAGILIVNAKQCRLKEVSLEKLKRYGDIFIKLTDFYIEYMKEGL